MLTQLTEVIGIGLVGVIVGLIVVKLAPKRCVDFHRFSLSRRSLPLHLFSVLFFGCSFGFAILEQNYLMAILGGGMTAVSLLASLAVVRTTLPPQPNKESRCDPQ